MKLQLCAEGVQYSGHKFRDKGQKVDKDKVKATEEFTQCSNLVFQTCRSLFKLGIPDK